MRVGGSEWKPSGQIHRLERRTWPERYVVHRIPTGWNHCAGCERQHRIWMTDDAVWALVPRKWRRQRVCVGCFRYLAACRAIGRRTPTPPKAVD